MRCPLSRSIGCFAEGMRLGGLGVSRESALMINNIVAREFTRESDRHQFRPPPVGRGSSDDRDLRLRRTAISTTVGTSSRFLPVVHGCWASAETL